MGTWAYLRVSRMEQDLEKNKAEILRFANERDMGKVLFVEDKVSGGVSWKQRKIYKIVSQTGAGDNIIVSELSRLGRSMLECMEILSVCLEKKVKVYALKGNWCLDDSLQSKLIAMGFAIAAEIERELISQRTKEALKARLESGKPVGRPRGSRSSSLDRFQPEIEALLNNGATVSFIARRYKTSRANLTRWIKSRGLKRKE